MVLRLLFLSPFHQGRASPLCCALLVSLLAARPARGEFVISGFIGDSKTQSAPLTIVQPEIGTRVRLHAHAESVVEGITHEGYELGALAVHGGAGIELRVTRSLALLAEYKFTRTRQSVDIDRGKAEGVFGSHHAVVGVGWKISRQ